MKVLGQSTQSPSRPYVHLGYTAATVAPPLLAAAGFPLLAVGLILFVRRIVSRASGSPKAHGRSLKRELAIAGVMIIAGIACLILARMLPWERTLG